MAEEHDAHSLAVGRAFPWHELYSADPDGSLGFYRDALGFDVEAQDMGPGGKYHMLKKDGKAVAGYMDTRTLPGVEVPPHWAIYHAVDDVDARLEKCQALGATLVVPPMDIPNVGRIALIADPQGAHIWLYKPG